MAPVYSGGKLFSEVTHVFHRQVRRHQYQHALARYGRDKQVTAAVIVVGADLTVSP